LGSGPGFCVDLQFSVELTPPEEGRTSMKPH